MFFNCKYCNHKTKPKVERLEIVECEHCKLVFCQKTFSQKELSDTYNNLYNSSKKTHYDVHTKYEFVKLQKETLPRIGFNRKRLIDIYCNNTSLKVLEIGSGIGLIGSYLRKKKIKDYLGLELDKETCKKAASLGLNVVNSDFSYMSKLDSRVDIIMLWEVLEHLQDIKLFLELSYQNTVPNGLLLFSVPNFNKIKNYRITKNKHIYQDEPPIHLNFFTKENIHSVLEKAGYKVEYLYIKKTPYLNFKQKQFYEMLWKALLGKYHGSSIYVAARKA